LTKPLIYLRIIATLLTGGFMETEPVPQPEPEAPPPPKRFPWLVPVLGLLAILIIWLLSDVLLFQRSPTFLSSRTLLSVSQKRARMNSELQQLSAEITLGHIPIEKAQARLDSIAQKYHVTRKDEEVAGVQGMIQEKRRLEGLPPDSIHKTPEWPVILSMPPPESGSHK
jgi:hypothetical protein